MRTPEADRFQHECEVPDLPLSPKGRQRYWDETVFEAVAELRKRLHSQDIEEAKEAMEMIVDLEKTRIRHASKVSGTHVPNLRDLEDDWGNPLPTGERRDVSPPVPEQETSPSPSRLGRPAYRASQPSGTGGLPDLLPVKGNQPTLRAVFADAAEKEFEGVGGGDASRGDHGRARSARGLVRPKAEWPRRAIT